MIISAHRVFQGKMPLIPIRLKELTPTSGKTQGRKGIQRTSGKRVNLIGKGSERPMDMKKAVFKEIRQMENTMEAGQSTIGNRSKTQCQEVFDFWVSPSPFLLVFCL
jgi:hypothetical protein